jgi:hypothetical protein
MFGFLLGGAPKSGNTKHIYTSAKEQISVKGISKKEGGMKSGYK